MEPIVLTYDNDGLDEEIDLLGELADELDAAGKMHKDLVATMGAARTEAQRLARTVGSLARAYDRLSTAAGGAMASLAGAASSPAASGGSGASRAVGARAAGPRPVKGPASRMKDAWDAWVAARQANDPVAAFDAQAAFGGASRAFGKASGMKMPAPPVVDPSAPKAPKGPKSPAQLVMDALMTSRMGGGGMMPLVGKSSQAIGALLGIAPKALGIAGIAVAAGIKMYQTIFEMAHKAAERGMAVAGLSYGSTAGGAAGAYGAAGAFGIDPSRIGRQDAGIHQFGSSWHYARKAGIDPYRNAYTGHGYDDAGNFVKELKQLLYDESLNPGQRKAAAQAYGMEDALPFHKASYWTKDQMMSRAYQPLGASDAQGSQAANFLAETRLLMGDFGDIVKGLGGIALPFLTHALKTIEPYFRGLAVTLDHVSKFVSTASQAVDDFFDRIYKWLKRIMPWAFANEGKEKEKSSRDRHADALDRHTDAMNAGTYGGGQRTRDAQAKGWGGDQVWNEVERAARMNAIAGGALV